ncbi:pullulanase-type alpha-1,6-glucosidase [Tunturibacter empetritectus]|uniref:Pullulanase n=1 Tax=Tunturiibacter lichenicola TaxID=2051959 RepID=A0A7W8J694_9BACT|nr:pullulanase-type alpha-1,6-glucosidase [Edaphobacter lichenicola]MBB5343316.1 pullulanase [Edaphobacter lichenicola]
MKIRIGTPRLLCRASSRALMFLLCVFASAPAFGADPAIPSGDIRIHYHRPDGNYSGWTVYAFDNTTEDTGNYGGGPVQVTGTDSFGAYFDVGVTPGAQEVGIIIHNPTASGGDQKDTPSNLFVDPATQGIEYWAYSGIAKLYTAAPSLTNPAALLPGYARIHYYRPDGNYANWTVYAFNDTAEYTGDYNDGLTGVTSHDSYGAYFDVSLIPNPKDLGFIVHNISTGVKDPGPDMHLNVASDTQAWVISGNATVFTTTPTPTQILNSLLNVEQAYWLDRQRVAIQPQFAQSGDTFAISSSLTGGLSVTPTGVTGGVNIPLTVGGALTADELLRYPQLSGYTVLQLPENTQLSTLQTALEGQLAFSAIGSNGMLNYATGIQFAGVLDDLYYYPGKLGVVVHHWDDKDWRDWPDDEDCAVKLKLWAPTAQSVFLQLFDHESDTAPSTVVPMHEHDGVWVAKGDPSWKGKYYLYSVKVWVSADGAVDTNVTTDPYSIDIALNGTKSRITDLDSDKTKPAGWDEETSPPLRSVSDMSIYELHIRDFSVNDLTVPLAHRGMYEAFADRGSDGMMHLRSLAESGLKAVHILPSFHFASVNEDKSKWIIPTGLAAYPPDGQQQQAAVTASQTSPAYNWGYDPVHYMTPEGSYAINPDNRVREYRVMVDGLHKAGLRVVQDVVFNHTNASGEGPNSNLDEVVPNYYHRLDANGNLETGSCCPDTASEHRMMEKLIIDTLVLNAKDYKIDGFRFDILSFMFTYNVQAIQHALQALTLEKDGVDGSKIYLYGEGFNFGDTANNQIGPNASQINLYGFGVGTFNDRIRDGIHGGSPFTDERVQGFATGLFTDPSDYTISNPPLDGQQNQLLQYSDWIDVGLTGNLRDYSFTDSAGATVTGAQVLYNGQPTGYTKSPIEAVNYASVHDNQDLFDKVQLKSSYNDNIATRARRQVMGMSLVTLGEGIPFFQAGDDLLRSKDMDQNSYNSGDWFNKIDWSGKTANWGIGLPIASQNQAQWPIMMPLLSNPAYTPLPANIAYSKAAFSELLQIRYSSELFRMPTFEEVQRNLTFLNTGSNQTPGLIVMKLDANGGSYGIYKHIVVVFNATNASVTFTNTHLQGLGLHLHPVQRNSSDPETRLSTFNSKEGTATVPALTTAVFVAETE